MRKILAALFGLALIGQAQAEYITVTPASGGGGTTGPGIITACGSSDKQVLFTDGVTCAGNAGLTFTKGSGTLNATILTTTAETITQGATDANSALTIVGQTGVLAASQPVINATQTWNAAGVTFTGIKLNVTATANNSASLLQDLQVGAASQFSVDVGGNVVAKNGFIVGSAASTGGNQTSAFGRYTGTGYVTLANGGGIGWVNAANWTGGPTYAAQLSFFGVGTLGLSDSTTATTLQVYNTTDSTTSPTNYERGVFDWNVTANTLTIGTQAGGTGTVRNVTLMRGSAAGVTVTSAAVNIGSTLNFTTSGGTKGIGTASTNGQVSFSMPGNGTNYGQIWPVGNNSWALGYGTNQFGTAGTAAITWTDNGTVTIAPNNSITTITGSLTVSALANVATTSAVCYNTGTGVLTYDGTIGTCTVSAMRFKNPIADLAVDRNALDALHPAVWTYKDASMGVGERVGLYADDVERMDPRCVSYASDGQLQNYDERCVIAYLVAEIKSLKARINR